MRIGVISIGNEILIGETINTNLSWLGKQIFQLGLSIDRCITVQDNANEIRYSLQTMWEEMDIVLCTGGLGPTNDDITKASICNYFEKELYFDDPIWTEIVDRFSRRGEKIPEINRNQALVPRDFTILTNQMGTAPGLLYQKGDKLFVAMPGVPIEMQYLYKTHVEKYISGHFAISSAYINTIHTCQIAESRIAEILSDLELEEGVKFAYLPQTGRVDLRIYGTNHKGCERTVQIINTRLNRYIWGYNDDNIVRLVSNYCNQKGIKLSVAESCTGGLVQKWLTDIPGSSSYFVGGIVSYANEVKEKVLGVSPATIDKEGAVSEATAIEMVRGLGNLLHSELSCAITGIAGPDGGTAEKPVGLVYLAVSYNGQESVEKRVFLGNRDTIRIKAAEHLLMMILKILGHWEN